MRSTRLSIVAILFLSIAACGDDDTPTRQIVGPTGGTVTSADGAVTLEFPAGALPADTEITITPVADAPDQGFEALYEFGPDGTQFAQPVTITLHGAGDLTGARIAKAIDGGPGKWADDIVVDGDTIQGTVHSFSKWGWTYCGQLWCMEADANQTPRGVKVKFHRQWTSGAGFFIQRAFKNCLNGTTIEECLMAPGDASFGDYWNWSGCGQCPPGALNCECDHNYVILIDTNVAADSKIYYYRFKDDDGGGARAFLVGDSTVPGPCENFTVSANPSSYTMAFNGSGSTTIDVSRLNGFTGAIELVYGGMQPFEGLRFDATQLAPGVTSTVFHTDFPFQRGTFQIPVSAQPPGGGGSTCTTTVSVTVQ